MSRAATEKARNLARLRELGFHTPPFIVAAAREPLPDLGPLTSSTVILRSCTLAEDQSRSSGAGQSRSTGPVAGARIREGFEQLGAERAVREIVIQQFVDAPTGVLLCADPERALLEYSSVHEGVTAGWVRPFTAVFPNDVERYREVAELVRELVRHFGACDAELALTTPISLLQVRPLTRPASFDESAARLKMKLQELPFASLVQDEFCTDLAESPHTEVALIEAYCECRRELFAELDIDGEPWTPAHFIKVGRQVFAAAPEGRAIELAAGQVFALTRWSAANLLRLWWSRSRESLTARELMRCAVSLRTLGEFVDRLPRGVRRALVLRVLASRGECRARLNAVLPVSSLGPAVDFERLLDGPLIRDDARMSWQSFQIAGELGQVVVAGDFETGPYRVWSPDLVFPEERVVLLCDRLDPRIFSCFAHLKAILCEGGGVTSHLAILAREFQMPLRIQVAGAIARHQAGREL